MRQTFRTAFQPLDAADGLRAVKTIMFARLRILGVLYVVFALACIATVVVAA